MVSIVNKSVKIEVYVPDKELTPYDPVLHLKITEEKIQEVTNLPINHLSHDIDVHQEPYKELVIFSDSDGIPRSQTIHGTVVTINAHPKTPKKNRPDSIGLDQDTSSYGAEKADFKERAQIINAINNELDYIAHLQMCKIQDLFYPLYSGKFTCLGHDLYPGRGLMCKHKNKRKFVKQLDIEHRKKFEEKTSGYKKCSTQAVEIDGKHNRFRFFAKVFHKDSHPKCKCMEYNVQKKFAQEMERILAEAIKTQPDQLQSKNLFKEDKLNKLSQELVVVVKRHLDQAKSDLSAQSLFDSIEGNVFNEREARQLIESLIAQIEVPVLSSNSTKKCLGHVNFLYQFPIGNNANKALRNLSHNCLHAYSQDPDKLNAQQGYLKTHAYRFNYQSKTHQELFIFYQHKDNVKNCDKYCKVPQVETEKCNMKNKFDELTDSLQSNGYEVDKEVAKLAKLAIGSKLKVSSDKKSKLAQEPKNTFSFNKRFFASDEFFLNIPLEHDLEAIPYPEPQPYYKPSQSIIIEGKECPYGETFHINGMLKTCGEAIETAQAISQMQGGNKINLLYNSTLGFPRDAIQQAFIKNGTETPISRLVKEQIMNYFEKAEKDQILYISVHSQGGAILKQVLPLIPEAFRNRMYIDTYGTAGFIEEGMAKIVRNFWHPNDTVSKLADYSGWKKAEEDGTLITLKNDGKPLHLAHALFDGYEEIFQDNNLAFSKGEFL